LDAAQRCLGIGTDSDAAKFGACVLSGNGKMSASLECAEAFPALATQAKLVKCFRAATGDTPVLLACSDAIGVPLNSDIADCVQSAGADGDWKSCLSSLHSPAIDCVKSFGDDNEKLLTCLANQNPTTQQAVAAIKCLTSGNDPADLISACTANFLPDKPRQALACVSKANGDLGSMASCAAAPYVGGEPGRLLTCATQSQDFSGFALCAAGPKMTPEWMIAAQCAVSSGGVPVATGACRGHDKIGATAYAKLDES
jgi:hypothetical protein